MFCSINSHPYPTSASARVTGSYRSARCRVICAAHLLDQKNMATLMFQESSAKLGHHFFLTCPVPRCPGTQVPKCPKCPSAPYAHMPVPVVLVNILAQSHTVSTAFILCPYQRLHGWGGHGVGSWFGSHACGPGTSSTDTSSIIHGGL